MTNTDLHRGFYVGDWEIQPLLGQVVGPDGPVHVEPRVMDVLLALAARPGELLERDKLTELVWKGRAMSDDPLNRCISRLRNIFDDSPQNPEYIDTVPTRGYRLIAPVRPLSPNRQSVPAPKFRLNRRLIAVPVVLIIVAMLVFVINGSAVDRSIAVLPFDNVGGDDTEEYFRDGLTDEITNRLARVDGLRVAARTSSFSFRDSVEDATDVAGKLGVAYLLDGSILREGDIVRIYASLVDADGYRIWSDKYEGVMTDVFTLQDEISNDIVRQIAPELAGEDDQPRIRTEQPTQDLQAYDLVLQGRYHLARRGEVPLRRSIDLFQEAIAIDESYGDAYTGLATAYAVLPFYSREAVEESFDLAMAIIEKGAQMDASVDLKAAGILAFILYHGEWRWIEAESAFRKALQYTPNDADLLNWYSVFMSGVGRIDEALDAAVRARDLDRLSPVVNQRLAVAHLWTDNDELAYRYFEVANQLGMAPATQPEAYIILLLRRQEYGVARQLMSLQQVLLGYDTAWVEALFMAMQDPEYRAAAVQAVLEAEQSGDIRTLHLFGVWVYLDEVDRAVDAALALIRDRVAFNTEFLFARESAALRQHPRFGEIIRGIKLDRYWDYFGWPEMCEGHEAQIICR